MTRALGSVTLGAVALGAALALAAAAGAQADAQSPPDVPAGDGAIVGRVLRAADGAPVGGVEVVLYALPSAAQPGLRRGTAGPDGRFAFEGIGAEPTTTYLVGARYEGVSYPGARVQFAEGERRREVEVRVHEVSADAGRAVARELRVRLDWLGDRLVANETVALSNPGARTLFVAPAARDGAAPALSLGLPAGARNLTGPLGLLPEGAEVADGTLRWFGPLFPGDNELSFAYEIPVREGRVDLARSVPAPLRVTLLAPAGGPEVDAPGLAAGEPTVEGGRGYRTWSGELRDGRLALSLRVPAARSDAAAVSLAEVRVIGELDAAAFIAREEHVIRVEGDTPIVAADDTPLVRIPLPRGASDLRFGAPESGTRLVPLDDEGLGVLGPLAPGETVLEVRYRIPVSGGAFTLERHFGAHLPLLSVYVADTGHLDLSSERLHRRRPLKTPDRTYLHFEAFEVAPGERPALRIASRPPRRELPRAATVALVALGAGLLAFVLAAPLLRERAAPGAELPVDVRGERDLLDESLLDLEHDFETGKLEPGDYESMRAELRARAETLREREEAAPADAAPPRPADAPARGAPPAAGADCGACGHAAAPGDRFCARCGARLLAA